MNRQRNLIGQRAQQRKIVGRPAAAYAALLHDEQSDGLVLVEQSQDDQRVDVETGKFLADRRKRLGELHVGGAEDRLGAR